MAVDLERLELALPGIWTPPAGEAVQSLAERYAAYKREDIFAPELTDFYVAHFIGGASRRGLSREILDHRCLVAQDRIRWLAVQLALMTMERDKRQLLLEERALWEPDTRT